MSYPLKCLKYNSSAWSMLFCLCLFTASFIYDFLIYVSADTSMLKKNCIKWELFFRPAVILNLKSGIHFIEKIFVYQCLTSKRFFEGGGGGDLIELSKIRPIYRSIFFELVRSSKFFFSFPIYWVMVPIPSITSFILIQFLFQTNIQENVFMMSKSSAEILPI